MVYPLYVVTGMCINTINLSTNISLGIVNLREDGSEETIPDKQLYTIEKLNPFNMTKQIVAELIATQYGTTVEHVRV